MSDPYTIKEFKNVRDLVLTLLANDERARNSDKWLTFRVFEEIAKANGERIYIPFKLFKVFPSFATVKRVRAKIQNEEGLYLPTDAKEISRRKQRQHTIKSIMGR